MIEAFKECWLNNYGSPVSLLTDNGSQYCLNEFENFLVYENIQHFKITPYNPTGNALAERVNQNFKTVLKIYKDWNINLMKEIIGNKNNMT